MGELRRRTVCLGLPLDSHVARQGREGRGHGGAVGRDSEAPRALEETSTKQLLLGDQNQDLWKEVGCGLEGP